MSTHEWVVVLITAAISVPVGMLSIALYNPIEKWRSRYGGESARRQLKALNARLRIIEDYRRDPGKLHEYLIARLLYISLLWIGQEALDGVIGAVTNIQYGLAVTRQEFSVSASITAAGEALLASVLLTIVLLIGIRAYRIYRDVRGYDSYKERVDRELDRLGARIKSSQSDPGDDDLGTLPAPPSR